MAGASTYEREVLHPGPTGRGCKIYATPPGKWREVRAARALALTKERSRSLMSGWIIDSIVCGSSGTEIRNERQKQTQRIAHAAISLVYFEARQIWRIVCRASRWQFFPLVGSFTQPRKCDAPLVWVRSVAREIETRENYQGYFVASSESNGKLVQSTEAHLAYLGWKNGF